MKTARKVLILALCAVLLISATVMGTLAYLTSTDSVKNTFTVGKVAITLDEAPVDVNGNVVEGDARTDTNAYKLMPGHAYTKDPTVHFAAGSEASYLFVKVENGIAAIESKAEGYNNILAQVVANGWTKLEGVDNVYYKQVPASATAVDYAVFASFTIADDVDAATLASYENAEVNVTAYAIQADGLATAAAAWTAGGWN